MFSWRFFFVFGRANFEHCPTFNAYVRKEKKGSTSTVLSCLCEVWAVVCTCVFGGACVESCVYAVMCCAVVVLFICCVMLSSHQGSFVSSPPSAHRPENLVYPSSAYRDMMLALRR